VLTQSEGWLRTLEGPERVADFGQGAKYDTKDDQIYAALC